MLDLMLKGRAKYAGILAGVAAPVYLLIQLVLGSDVRPSLVRTLWFFVVVFLVSLAVRWETKTSAPTEADEQAPPVQD